MKNRIRRLIARFRTWQLRTFRHRVARPGMPVWCHLYNDWIVPGKITYVSKMVECRIYFETADGTVTGAVIVPYEKLEWRSE